MERNQLGLLEDNVIISNKFNWISIVMHEIGNLFTAVERFQERVPLREPELSSPTWSVLFI
jgi:hypothetical protein